MSVFQRRLTSGSLETSVHRLWQAYLETPVRSWRHRWRLWLLRREFDLTPPDPQTWSWRFPKTRLPACSTCPDVCCKGPRSTVLLRLVDLARFVDRGLTDHITLEKPVFEEELLGQRPLLREMIQSFHWQVFPVLKQKPDGTCTFLDPQGRCSIHPDRPWVCRVFPFFLDIDSQAIDWSDRCRWFFDLPPPSAPPQKTSEADVLPLDVSAHPDRTLEADGPPPQAPVSHSLPSDSRIVGTSALRELQEAVFHNFYTEKIRDLVLLRVYSEEIEASGLAAWLRLPKP